MNKVTPLVSVIVPFLNAERFIQETIESVFLQTYKEWELLLVDDGSSDHSTRIAQDYADKCKDKVRFLEHNGHENKGASATRNLGIIKSKGEYISFLDADDVWVEKKLEEQVKILEAHKEAGMVYGKTRYWYSWTGEPEDLKSDYIVNYNIKLNTLVAPPELLILALESKAITPNPSNIMVRRDIVLKIGGFEDVFRGMHDDQAFLAKLFINTQAYISERCWDFYRKHKDSLSTEAIRRGEKVSAELFYLSWLDGYMCERGINNIRLWSALRRRKWRFRHPTLYKIVNYRYRISRAIRNYLNTIARYVVPQSVQVHLNRILKKREYSPPPGWVRFGDLRRLKPFSERWGKDRGLPIDRYYIESFMDINSKLIKGRVLEFGDDRYTQKFYNPNISMSDVLNLNKETNPATTIIADIVNAPQIPSDTYECIIFTQTLQFIYEHKKAVGTLYRILAPGGSLLATFPGISPTSGTTWNRYWCWNFTALSAANLFNEFFPRENLEVRAYGNLICAAGFLYGLSAEELTLEELNYHDPRYEIVLTVKAVKP